MRRIRRHAREIRRQIENGEFEEAVRIAIEDAGMRPQEIRAYIERKGAPHLTESQIRDFMQIAEPLERERLIQQFERFYGKDE